MHVCEMCMRLPTDSHDSEREGEKYGRKECIPHYHLFISIAQYIIKKKKISE